MTAYTSMYVHCTQRTGALHRTAIPMSDHACSFVVIAAMAFGRDDPSLSAFACTASDASQPRLTAQR